jgi:P-type Ca2+ transporter type 2C
VREQVPGAIAACQRAGVRIKMITGDTPLTAQQVGRTIGLPENIRMMTGPEFAALDDDAARREVQTLDILARARPRDKMRLVELLKEQGEIVAVTGDGVNDGPALNHAHVGLAMGKAGTAVAKEASDIILLDDSFSSIVEAIRWGRSLYENIQRFILFQLTINVAALMIALLGPFIGVNLPLTVMQMLWINLLMDTFAALALATEPPNDAVLTRKPRAVNDFIVTRKMAKLIFGTGLFFVGVLLAAINSLGGPSAFPGDEATRAGTLFFTLFVLLQFWNLFNCRVLGRNHSAFARLGKNPFFLAIAVTILIGQWLIVQYGGSVFRTVPLPLQDWVLLLVGTSPVLLLPEAWRVLRGSAKA